MKKLLLLPVLWIVCLLLVGSNVNGQVLDGIYAKEHVPSRKPIPYKFLREADVMWTKRVWRVIDLREKINHALYYPTARIGDRMSLIDLLLWGINTEGLTAYNTDNDQFSQPLGRAQIETNFGAVEKPITYTDENGVEQTKTIKGEIVSSEIKQYWLKEDWFFDRQHSSMDVRIVGISPIRFYVKDDQGGTDAGLEPDMRKAMVFWIYFPEARRILANHEVFNEFNDAERRTYDDIFFKRKFNSYIIKISNVYDDRAISEYSLGIQSLLESETLKKTIADYEQDLWEY
jgi:gliding motility associated protien GldN